MDMTFFLKKKINLFNETKSCTFAEYYKI